MTITPAPEDIFRIWFYFSPIGTESFLMTTGIGADAPVNIKSIHRSDYSVVEWGGLVGK